MHVKDKILEYFLESANHRMVSKKVADHLGITESKLVEEMEEIIDCFDWFKIGDGSAGSKYYYVLRESEIWRLENFLENGGYAAFQQNLKHQLRQAQLSQERSNKELRLELEKLRRRLKEMDWLALEVRIAMIVSAVALVIAIFHSKI